MDDPVNDITQVIHLLTQTPPSIQRATIERYFLPDAAFTHPSCRTGSFLLPYLSSRTLIRGIYRWYKIMSPRIELSVTSVAFDEQNLILYTTIHQLFRIWLLPFHRAPVRLTTVLQLTYSTEDGKYYIKSQKDLYQLNDIAAFGAWPLGPFVVTLVQVVSSLVCLIMALVCWPISVVEEAVDFQGIEGGELAVGKRGEE